MGAAEQRNFTTDDTIRMLQAKATEATDDFLVKVFRKPHAAAIPGLVASLSGAAIQHFTSPELWLPVLAGGGKYLLQGYHATDTSRAIGGFINFPIDNTEVRDVDFTAPSKTDWRGPATLEYPKPGAARQQENLPLYGLPQSPPAPGSFSGATNINPGGLRSAGGGVHREEYGGNGWREGASALEAERRTLEKEKLEAEREKHRAELAAIKSQHDNELKMGMAQLRAEFAATRPTGPDPMSTLFTEMMKQANEDRRAAATQAAEDRRATQAAQERADARFMAMMEKMNERKEKDPLEMISKVIELTGGGKKAESGIIEAQTKMLHSMSEMTSQQINVAMDFVSAAADMHLGGQKEEKPGWEKAVDKLIKGVGNFAQARSATPPPGQQIVNQIPTPVPQTFEQQARQPPPPPPQQPRPPQNHTDLSVADQVKNAIMARHDVKEVAAAVIAFKDDPSITQAFIAGGGDPEQAIKNLLGPWAEAAPSNGEYLVSFFKELEAQAIKAGLITPDAAAENEDDEDEDDEGDDQQGDEADE